MQSKDSYRPLSYFESTHEAQESGTNLKNVPFESQSQINHQSPGTNEQLMNRKVNQRLIQSLNHLPGFSN